MTHTAALDHALAEALTGHRADVVAFTPCGVLHTVTACSGKARFVATAQTSAQAFALAMTGLRAATGGAR